jgi:hypothetical protein
LSTKRLGFSEHSKHKHLALPKIVTAALPIIGTVSAAQRGGFARPLLLIETHAGPGVWADGIEGSPVILLQAAERRSVLVRMLACELDATRREALQGVMADRQEDVVIAEDYRSALSAASELLGGKHSEPPFGLVNVDPTGDDFDHEAILSALSGPYLRRMDVILHYSETANRRAVAVAPSRARINDKIDSFGRAGFQMMKFAFPQDRGNDRSWRWRLAYGSRFQGNAPTGLPYLDAVREAALGAGLLQDETLF